MAEKRVMLTLDGETYARVAGRAAADDCTVQNVVVAACREYVGERQRNRVGHVGGRPETLRGGPVEAAAPGHGPRTLEMRIGRNTCLGLETRATRDGMTLHSVIVRAVKAWVGGPAAPARAPALVAPSPRVPSPPATSASAPPPSPPASLAPQRVLAVPPPDRAQVGPPPEPGARVVAHPKDDAHTPALDALVAAARRHLEPILHRSGNILYSGVETLRPGPVYLLGLNPGGDPEDHILRAQTIGSTLDELPTKHVNEWLDKSWRRGGTRTEPGQSLLQRRVQLLLRGLGLEPRDVCAANLIFARSKDAATSGFADHAPICWPVHEAILDIVRPSLVVTFGNSGFSPYGYLRGVFTPAGEESFPSGHGNWDCRTFDAGRFRVVGLPHLGRYAIDRHPGVVTWTRGLLDAPR